MRRVRNQRATHRQDECLICGRPIRVGEEIACYEATAVGEDFRFANHDHARCADLEEVYAYEDMALGLDELSADERQRYLALNTRLDRQPQLN